MSRAVTKESKSIKIDRFVGVSLSGAKNEKTSVAVLDYFPQQKRLFLSQIFDKWVVLDNKSTDSLLVETLKDIPNVKLAAFDSALQSPKCLRCNLPCPGYEKCDETEITWMWKHYRKVKKEKKNVKVFTPYAERCVDFYLANELEESFQPNPAMGSNMAPLFARTHFLRRRWKVKAVEYFAKLSLWRIGNALKVAKSHLRFHKHAVGGDESRHAFLRALIEEGILFIYQQDLQKVINNPHSFDAVLGALTAFLQHNNQCEKKPKDFPRIAQWMSIPKDEIRWS